jgi:hypothetical protein
MACINHTGPNLGSAYLQILMSQRICIVKKKSSAQARTVNEVRGSKSFQVLAVSSQK